MSGYLQARLGKPGAFFFPMPERVLSAGVVVVRQEQGEWRVLLLRVYNYWDCPKGLVTPGEAPLAAAIREVREETGIDDLDFRWGEDFVETAEQLVNDRLWKVLRWAQDVID